MHEKGYLFQQKEPHFENDCRVCVLGPRPAAPAAPSEKAASLSPSSNVEQLLSEISEVKQLLQSHVAGSFWSSMQQETAPHAEIVKHLLNVGFSPKLCADIVKNLPSSNNFQTLLQEARSQVAGLIRTIDSFSIFDQGGVFAFIGPTGVGKTTTAAALAVQAAHTGRRVVLITIDPAKRLADALGLDGLSNDPSRVDLACSGELWAMMLDARSTFDDVIRRESRDLEQQQAILENPFYSNIASRLSGSQEYMAAEKLYELSNDERFDLVVVDTPPSREALDFLDAPQKLMNFLDHRVYRWIAIA